LELYQPSAFGLKIALKLKCSFVHLRHSRVSRACVVQAFKGSV